MKTTLELPDTLMREVKIRAAKTDRKLKDVVAELIQRGLAAVQAEVQAPRKDQAVKEDEPMEAVFAAGEELARSGVDIGAWAAHSRDAWR